MEIISYTKKLLRQFSLWGGLCLCMTLSLSACSSDDPEIPEPEPEPTPTPKPEPVPDPEPSVEWKTVTAQPDTWDKQKRADMTYQLLVYSFADSNGDGWGDFNGITQKLDYIDQMGVNAIWLSPIHPCMSYHGYDVTDYTKVNPKFGTESDFDNLVAEAGKRGIKIYLDYVMNHTGSDHPWFLDACAKADSPYRDYFIFSENPEADIKAGNIPMIEKTGYNAGEWFAANNSTVKDVYKFVLDWSNPSKPTVTVTKAEKADAENTTKGDDDRFLWYGNQNKAYRFYNKGNGKYELTVDFESDWGFLIRTSDTTWDGGTKYGAATGAVCKLGEALALDNQTAADIKFDFMKSLYFHSHFYTDWFADLNYGPVDKARESGAYKALLEAAKGWVDRGVSGLRLDAVKHIYHNATSNENPQFLKMFYEDMDTYYKQKGNKDDFYMIGEVLSEHNEVAPYYAGLPAFFEFSFWYRLEWAINNASGCYFAKDILSYQKEYAAYRNDYIEATKLTNHDEDRAASKLGKSTDKCKLAAAMLLTAAGSPYIYYGEELGMYGTKSNGDEYVRAPMLWGDNFVTGYTDKIDKNMTGNIKSVDKQKEDANSLLNTYLTFNRLRNTYPALATGKMEKHPTYNETKEKEYLSIAAWYMTEGNEKLLVIHNLKGAAVELPLTDKIEKVIAVQGSVEQKGESGNATFKMGAYSSLVLKIAQ